MLNRISVILLYSPFILTNVAAMLNCTSHAKPNCSRLAYKIYGVVKSGHGPFKAKMNSTGI